jgi:hypothetical protein
MVLVEKRLVDGRECTAASCSIPLMIPMMATDMGPRTCSSFQGAQKGARPVVTTHQLSYCGIFTSFLQQRLTSESELELGLSLSAITIEYSSITVMP